MGLATAAVFQRFIRAPLLLLALLSGGFAEKAMAEPARGIVTFTFDDALKVQYRNALPIAQSFGITGTLYVPSGLIDQSTRGTDFYWLMNWAEVNEFHQAGWEIGSHSRSHPRLTEIDPIAREYELHGAILDIERQIGVVPVSFSSPFGDFDDPVIEDVMKWYESHVSWKGHLGRNPIDAIDPRYIGRMEVISSMSSAQVCGEMVRAAQTDTWLVLLFHGVVRQDPGETEVTEQKFREVLGCANILAQNGIIQINTVRDALDMIDERN